MFNAMDYVEMMKDKELILGFQQLISDSDSTVVKRTVKVFTSSYYHTLEFLALKQLEAEEFLECWSLVRSIVDALYNLVKPCENEGLLLQLIKFTEATVTIHLLHDFSSFSAVFDEGRQIVKRGLTILKDLVTTPYIGGSAFILAVRSLISIACLRADLWEPVTDLLKKQLLSLPPTLFDHNVRSLHKILQRNLFRLLRRADTPELKSKLIEMMVGVGVPRKMVVPWAPLSITKRNLNQLRSENSLIEEADKAVKKIRTNESSDEYKQPRDPRLSPPRDPRTTSSSPRTKDEINTNTLQSCSNADEVTHMKNCDLLPYQSSIFRNSSNLENSNDVNSLKLENNKTDLQIDDDNSPKLDRFPIESQSEVQTVCNSEKLKNTPIEDETKVQVAETSKISEISSISDNKSLNFLTSLIPVNRSWPETPLPKSVLYDALDLYCVSNIVLHYIEDMPNEIPQNFNQEFEKLGKISSDVEIMRSRISNLMEKYLIENGCLNFSLPSSNDKFEPSTPELNVVSSNSESLNGTPSPPPNSDTDMRSHLPSQQSNDVDMRFINSKIENRDPRILKDPRLNSQGFEVNNNFKADVDHRILQARSDPRLESMKNRNDMNKHWDSRSFDIQSSQDHGNHLNFFRNPRSNQRPMTKGLLPLPHSKNSGNILPLEFNTSRLQVNPFPQFNQLQYPQQQSQANSFPQSFNLEFFNNQLREMPHIPPIFNGILPQPPTAGHQFRNLSQVSQNNVQQHFNNNYSTLPQLQPPFPTNVNMFTK